MKKKSVKLLDRAVKVVFVLALINLFMFTLLLFMSVGKVSGVSMDGSQYHDKDIYIGIKKHFVSDMNREDVIIIDWEACDAKCIKRIIAKEGDHLQLKGREVILNGKVLQEDYITPPTMDYEEIDVMVPKGKYFVMGDNRDLSLDSRKLGFVDNEEVSVKVINNVPYDSFLSKVLLCISPGLLF